MAENWAVFSAHFVQIHKTFIMQDFIALIAVAGGLASFVAVIYLLVNSRHKVRMALIQHGKEASIFKENKSGASGLKYGLLMLGIGLGIFMGMIIESLFQTDSPVPHFSMMLIMGGAGLIVYYLITKKRGDDLVD